MFLHKLGCRVHGCHPDLGRLVLRLALGAVFVVHGWMKLSDLGMANGFLTKLGMPNGTGALVGAVEFFGGLAVIAGIWVPVAATLLALVMVGAIALVKGKMGFVGGYEFDLTLLLAALAVAKLGAGRFSLDARLGACSCGGCPKGGCCKAREVVAVCDADSGDCVVSEKQDSCCG